MIKRHRAKHGSKTKIHRKIRGKGRRVVKKRPVRRYRRYRGGSSPLDGFLMNMLPGSELGGNLNDMANQAMNLLPMLL